jgi:hypothetical protein
MGGHDALLGHTIMIPSQPVLALTHYCCMLIVEASNINLFSHCIDSTEIRLH